MVELPLFRVLGVIIGSNVCYYGHYPVNRIISLPRVGAAANNTIVAARVVIIPVLIIAAIIINSASAGNATALPLALSGLADGGAFQQLLYHPLQ